MKIRWLGHSCFLITSQKGIQIVTDPYNKSLKYEFPPNISADVITVSHEHFDHNAISRVKGVGDKKPYPLRRTGDFQAQFDVPITRLSEKGEMLFFHGYPTAHDELGGRKRGPNTVFTWMMDAIKLCHLGDLGHLLEPKALKEIGDDVDVLFIPVGGTYTIDGKQAISLTTKMKPKIAIPMHYETPESHLSLDSVETYLEGMGDDVERLGSTTFEFDREMLKKLKSTKVIVLNYG